MDETKPKARRLVTAPLLTALGFVAWIISSVVSAMPFITPGGWSDFHSQWLGAFLGAIFFLGLFVATHWLWSRSKPLACCFWFAFGGLFTMSLYSLVVSQKFLTERGRAGPFNYLRHPSWFFDGTYYHEVPRPPETY